MKFYLMRHAQAEKGPELDITRKVTSIGDKQCEWMARFLLTQTDKIKLILHSDMHRGRDTAEQMAPVLGVDTLQHPGVGPAAEPAEVWKTIKTIWKQHDLGDDELLIIGHGPSINKFTAWLLDSGEGDKFHFSHASVCHFDTDTPDFYGPDNQGIEGRGKRVRAYLHWMATAKMVKRAIKEDADAEIVEAAGRVVDALADLVEAPKGESLRHPKHMKTIAPLRTAIKDIVSKYFTAQGHAIMKAVRKNIPAALEGVKEAKSPDAKKFSFHLLPDDVEPLTFAVTTAEKNVFAQALEDAITKAADQLQADIGKTVVTVGGHDYTFAPNVAARGGYSLISVDTHSLDASWAKDENFYIDSEGEGGIGDRLANFQQWLEDHPDTPIQAPVAEWSSGHVVFEDGRHRFSVLRDAGNERVVLAVPKDQVDTFLEKFNGEVKGTIAPDTVEKYLADHSLEKLTGDWSDTTLSRLRNAAAGSYASGGTADDIEAALQGVVDGFSDYRAAMIAQTEVNDAYNFGRREMADAAGMDEKAWDPDGEACEICMENVDAGWIDIDDDFPSGDDGPTAHPNCDCSLSFRMSTGEEVEESNHEAGRLIGV